MSEEPRQSRRIPTGVIVFVLWVATATVGLWEILIVRDTLLRIFARRFADRQ